MNSDAIIRKEMIMGKFRSKLTYIFTSADLEDIENIIDFYEQKVNQLETNRDETIKLIKFEWEEILKNEKYSNHLWSVDGLVIKEIISSLERGKE